MNKSKNLLALERNFNIDSLFSALFTRLLLIKRDRKKRNKRGDDAEKT